MLLPLPRSPTQVNPLLQSEPVPVTSTELFEELVSLPMTAVPKLRPETLPPLLITRLLSLPDLPMWSVDSKVELLPVTSTELFEELVLPPMVKVPLVWLYVPPLLMTILLPLPLSPTK